MSLLSVTPPSTRGTQGNVQPGSGAYTPGGTAFTPSYSAPAQAPAVLPSSYDGAADRASSRTDAFSANQFNTNLGNAYAAGSLANSATQTGLQLQYNLGLAQLQNYGQQYANSVGSDQDTYNNAIASNNLNTLGNLAQQAAIPRDEAYNQNSWLNQAGRYNDQTGYITTQGTLADQLQQIQNQGATITATDADRNARYAAEANGGGTTQSSYGANLASAGATYANQVAGNANSNAGTHASLADQQSGLNHNIWQSGLDTTEKQSQLTDQGNQLKLTAAQYGVNAAQLTSQLNHTLTSLNLQNQMTAGQILTDLGSNDAQRKQNALNIFFTAVAAAQSAGKQ